MPKTTTNTSKLKKGDIVIITELANGDAYVNDFESKIENELFEIEETPYRCHCIYVNNISPGKHSYNSLNLLSSFKYVKLS